MKAFVTTGQRQAVDLQKILGPEWLCLYPGQALLGYHFTHIAISEVVTNTNDCLSQTENKQIQDWLDRLVSTKLTDKKTKSTNVLYV